MGTRVTAVIGKNEGGRQIDVKKLLRSSAGDEEIKAFIRETVKVKPGRKSEMGQIRKCQRSLRNIGG